MAEESTDKALTMADAGANFARNMRVFNLHMMNQRRKRKDRMNNTCDNCGNRILVAIFKGSGHCSDDCRKAIEAQTDANMETLDRELPDPKEAISE